MVDLRPVKETYKAHIKDYGATLDGYSSSFCMMTVELILSFSFFSKEVFSRTTAKKTKGMRVLKRWPAERQPNEQNMMRYVRNI